MLPLLLLHPPRHLVRLAAPLCSSHRLLLLTLLLSLVVSLILLLVLLVLLVVLLLVVVVLLLLQLIIMLERMLVHLLQLALLALRLDPGLELCMPLSQPPVLDSKHTELHLLLLHQPAHPRLIIFIRCRWCPCLWFSHACLQMLLALLLLLLLLLLLPLLLCLLARQLHCPFSIFHFSPSTKKAMLRYLHVGCLTRCWHYLCCCRRCCCCC